MNYIVIFLNSITVLYTWHVFGNFLELYADFQNEKKFNLVLNFFMWQKFVILWGVVAAETKNPFTFSNLCSPHDKGLARMLSR